MVEENEENQDFEVPNIDQVYKQINVLEVISEAPSQEQSLNGAKNYNDLEDLSNDQSFINMSDVVYEENAK